VINVARGDCWELVNSFGNLAEHKADYALVATPDFRDSLRQLGSVDYQSYRYTIVFDNSDDAIDFVGRQVLEIHNPSILSINRAAFEAGVQRYCDGAKIVFTFEADIIHITA
jgi:hypothetical protein